MRNTLARISVPLGLSFILVHPSAAQEQVNFGRSPSINVLATPSIDKNDFIFSAPSGFTCPTPSLSFGGFSTGGNDWSNEYSTNRSAGSGINNFGIAAGIRVPLAGSSAQNCKEYSGVLLEKARVELEGARRSDQVALLQQCHWLLVNQINIQANKGAFSIDGLGKEGAFSSLNACISFKWQRPGPDFKDGQKVKESRTDYSLTTPPPSPATPQIPTVIQFNR